MRWTGRRQSGNVEDRRGMGGPIAIGGGILGLLPCYSITCWAAVAATMRNYHCRGKNNPHLQSKKQGRTAWPLLLV